MSNRKSDFELKLEMALIAAQLLENALTRMGESLEAAAAAGIITRLPEKAPHLKLVK